MATYEGDREVRFLEQSIVSVRTAIRRRAATVAGLWALAAVLACAAGLVATDAACHLLAGARMVVYPVIAMLGAGTVSVAVWVAWRRCPSETYVSRLMERARPDLKNALVTFVELRADPDEDPAMAAAVARRAARVLAEVDPAAFLPPVSYRRPAGAAGAGAFLLGAILWMAQGTVAPSWVPAAQASISRAGHVAPGGQGGVSAGPAADGVLRPGTTASQDGKPGGSTGGAQASPGGEGADDLTETVAALKADGNEFQRLASALGAGDFQPPDAANSPGAGGGSSGQAPSSGGPSGAGVGEKPSGAGRGQSAAGGSERQADGASAAQPDPRSQTPGPQDNPQPGDAAGQGRSEPGVPDPGRGDPSAASDSPDAGGKPGDDSPKRPRGPQGETPLRPRPQTADFPEKTLDSLRQAKRIINEAEQRLRDGDVTEAFLGEMGMNNETFRRFVTSWQRRLETPVVGPDDAAAPRSALQRVDAPSGELLRPQAPASATAILGTVAQRPDGKGGLVTGAEAPVSPRLRGAVGAYFETLGRLGAEKAAPKDSGR